MKRGGPLKRSDKPMAAGGLPAPTKEQKRVFEALVSQVGCAVCRFHMGIEDTPGEIHHILEGQRKISHDYVIPLCPVHHRQGVEGHPSRHSLAGCHGGLYEFEGRYGSEYELLDQCESWINQRYATGQDDDAEDADNSNTDSDADDHGNSDDVEEKPLSLFPLQAFCKRVHVDVMHCRVRLADPDNLNAKGAIDGLVKAGLLHDDSAKYVEGIYHHQEKVSTYAQEKTVITLREVG